MSLIEKNYIYTGTQTIHQLTEGPGKRGKEGGWRLWGGAKAKGMSLLKGPAKLLLLTRLDPRLQMHSATSGSAHSVSPSLPLSSSSLLTYLVSSPAQKSAAVALIFVVQLSFY